MKLLKTAPKIKDLKIQNALDRLKKFNLNKELLMMMMIMTFQVYLHLGEENHLDHLDQIMTKTNKMTMMMMIIMMMMVTIVYKGFY